MRRVSAGGQHPALFAAGRKLRLAHQPGYPFARRASPLIFEFTMNAWTPISPLMRDKNLLNLLRKLSIFPCALTSRTFAPSVKAAFRDSKHMAHHHDRKFVLVLFNKPILHLESREKMLTTFFNMSRSC